MAHLGARVFHRVWGEGIVEAEEAGGFDLVVTFDRYGRYKVPSTECRIIRPNSSNNVLPNASSYIPVVSAVSDNQDNITRWRKTVEAFRLGIVPSFALRDITIGRQNQIARTNEWLETNKGTMLVFGDYGQGKSHTIRYMRELAIENGFGVAYCDIGSETPMSRPKRVYRALMKSLTFKSENGRIGGLPQFLEHYARHVAAGGKNQFSENRFFGEGLDSMIEDIQKNQHLSDHKHEEFLDWISGEGTRWYGILPDHTTSANIYCNMLSALGRASNFVSKVNNIHYKGLLLIFDEGESVDAPYVVVRKRQRAMNFIKGLVELSFDSPRIFNERITNYNGVYTGQRTGLIYSGVIREVPFTDGLPNNMKIIFAFVPGLEEVTRELLTQYHCSKIELDEMQEKEKRQLIEKIAEIYTKAYGFNLGADFDPLVKRILEITRRDKNTRSVIKSAVEALDLRRFNPRVQLGVLLRY